MTLTLAQGLASPEGLETLGNKMRPDSIFTDPQEHLGSMVMAVASWEGYIQLLCLNGRILMVKFETKPRNDSS
jgi:hypothetical protein